MTKITLISLANTTRTAESPHPAGDVKNQTLRRGYSMVQRDTLSTGRDGPGFELPGKLSFQEFSRRALGYVFDDANRLWAFVIG